MVPEVDGSAAPLPAPRVRPVVPARSWWIGFGVAAFTACFASAVAYADGLPAWVTTTPGVDKTLHLFMGGWLAFFLDGALARRGVRLGRFELPLSSLLVLLPSGIDEVLQRFSEVRSSDPLDFAADVVGVTVFTWLSRRMAA